MILPPIPPITSKNNTNMVAIASILFLFLRFLLRCLAAISLCVATFQTSYYSIILFPFRNCVPGEFAFSRPTLRERRYLGSVLYSKPSFAPRNVTLIIRDVWFATIVPLRDRWSESASVEKYANSAENYNSEKGIILQLIQFKPFFKDSQHACTGFSWKS